MKGEGNQQDYGMRIYDPRLGKFLSVDPLTGNYPWYTPYQFAGNSPIEKIDLDGKEKVSVNSLLVLFNGLPKLKRSEWYEIDGKVLESSFAAAAKFNTENNNPGAYQNVEERNNFYQWAHSNASKKGSNWFGAAEVVTRRTAVGAAGKINLWWLNDGADKFLQEGNKFLFSYNMDNYKHLMKGDLNKTFKDANGENIALTGLTGKKLDYALVQYEQTKVQDFIGKYQKDNPNVDMNSVIGSINSAMGSSFAPADVVDVMDKEFKGGKTFDFKSYNDRVKLGQKLVDKFYEKKKAN